jgi:pimeloyl-ACP methyl ester carboxylesterase
MCAELIKLHTSDGLTHFGGFYPPQGAAKRLGVVFVHGMTGSFVGEMESVVPELVAEAGYATLAANNRGCGFSGAATETFAGCLPDLRAAIDFMTARGYNRVALLGHSKGGIKVAYYLAQTHDPRIAALGLLSPGADVHGPSRWRSFCVGNRDLETFMRKMKKLVYDGQGDRMISTPEWPYFVSARTLWDHYTTRGDDVLENIAGLALPLLAVCGEKETDWCTVVTTLRQSPPANTRVAIIPGADHVYTGVEPTLAHEIVEWLSGF